MATTKKSVKTSEQKVEKVDGTNVNKKGDETMNNTFNIFEFTKQKLIEEFFNAKENKEFELKVKHINDLDFNDKETGEPIHIDGAGKVLGYLAKNKAFTYNIIEQVEVVKDELKTVYVVKIKNFDIKAKAVSKQGKEYSMFSGALGRVLEKRYMQEATA